MKTAYFDCAAGISGDMCLGALVHAGASLPDLLRQLAMLPISDYQVSSAPVQKNGILGTAVTVVAAGNQAGRNLADILQLIEGSALSPTVKNKSARIFQRLAAAEGAVHGISAAEIHFHEVGAIDAIVDIVGTVICLELLEIDEIIASPLPMGHGFVRCAHGLLPLPAPATQQLLQGLPVYGIDQAGELVTPTGAAIISTLAAGFGPMPAMTVSQLGYGAGTKDFPFPNLLRISLGQRIPAQPVFLPAGEEIIVLETAIDDMNPEIFTYLWEKLFSLQALDVFLIPVQMKKGRPGTLLTVLCKDCTAESITALLFQETSTLGIRQRREHRAVCSRTAVTISTAIGDCQIKVSRFSQAENIAPEYESCRQLALINHLPLKEVYRIVLAAANDYRAENLQGWLSLTGGTNNEN